MRRRVTFSRNLTLSLSRTCQCYCKYCSFATHTAHLYPPEQVLEILDGAARTSGLTSGRSPVRSKSSLTCLRAAPSSISRTCSGLSLIHI